MIKRDGRWWKSLSTWRDPKPPYKTVPLQGAQHLRRIPEDIARLVYEEYHNDQTFERLHERGGFGVGEVIAALADIIERERGIKDVR